MNARNFSVDMNLDQNEGYSNSRFYGVTDVPPEERSLGIRTQFAMDFLDNVIDGDDPWCCFVSLIEPHDPFICGEEAFSTYDVDSLELQPNVFDGGSGLVSTAQDYMNFSQMLLNNGKFGTRRVLGRKSIELLSKNHLGRQITDNKDYPEGKGFGITVGVTTDPALAGEYGSPGNYYWGGAASTSFWIDPKEQLTAVFMTQLLVNPHGTRDKYRTLVYQAIDD